MKVLERLIQEIYPGKWEELEALDAKYNMVEAKLGYPPKKRYQGMAGTLTTNHLVIEREWESMAALEAVFEKAMAHPDWIQANADGASIIKSNTWELFIVLG